MPIHKCSNGKYRIGEGDCVFESKEKAERAYHAYLAQKHDDLSLEDIIKRQENSACKRRLIQMGFSQNEAETACAALLLKKDEEESFHEPEYDPLLMFVDDECVNNKISIFHNEHPDWSHDKCVAAAIGYCNKKGDSAIVEMIRKAGGKQKTSNVERTGSTVLRKLVSLIKTIKTKKGLKVGHMGLPPALMALPMKNLNRLQTKMERQVTEEEKYLTAEQQAQRAEYAKTMHKQDEIEWTEEMTNEFAEDFEKAKQDYMKLYPDKSEEEIINMLFSSMSGTIRTDSMWIIDKAEFGNANTNLNNIIKVPVTIAREIIQTYYFENEDGTVRSEEHFKPYEELKMAAVGLDELPMLIEHHDSWDDNMIIGYVRQIVADDKQRSIRGMAYFDINKIPQYLYDVLKTGGMVGVSIGFLAELGISGYWNGDYYDHLQKNIVYEHLAICLDSKPRCPLPLCGVNVEDKKIQDNVKFTIINKDNCYYNINKIIDSEETRIKNKYLESENKSDNMTEDSFPDPKSGKVVAEEPKDLATILKYMRAYINGMTEEIERSNFSNKRVAELLAMTDKDEDKTLKDEDNMNEKEFQDAIAIKDKRIADLEKFVIDSIKKEIMEFTTEDQQKQLKLDSLNCITKLETIRDTVTIFKPIEKEAEVLPTESKKELKDELKDKSDKAKRVDSSKLFAKTNEEFDLSTIEFLEDK